MFVPPKMIAQCQKHAESLIQCFGFRVLYCFLCFIYLTYHLGNMFFLGPWFFQSLRSRGIRFPGRDGESLAPIFTPPHSTTAPEPNASLAQKMYNEVPVISFSPEQTKEVFDVARNSIELLRTFLSSSPEQEALQVLYHIWLYFRSSN